MAKPYLIITTGVFMSVEELSNDFLSLISKKSLSLKVSGNGRGIIIGGYSFSSSTFTYEKLIEFLPEILDWPRDKTKQLIAQREALFKAVLDEAKATRDHTDFNPEGMFYDSDHEYPLLGTKVLINPKQNRFVILFNPETFTHRVLDRKIYEFSISEIPKEVKHNYNKLIWVEETYSPDLPPKYIALNDEQKALYPHLGTSVFNSYTPPENMSYPEPRHPKLHPTLKKYFDTFFINDASRDYMFRWLYTLAFLPRRKTPAIILCGKGAVGKGTLVEHIMMGIVGRSNLNKSSQVSDRFNSSVLNCQVHFFDEGTLTGINKRNLKAFHELYVAIEKKGIDVSAPERIFARFVIATNNRTDLHLDGNDRKFSVPEITDRKLKEYMTKEESDFLHSFQDNVEAQVEFRAWLKRYHEHDDPETPYHGPLFHQICFESLPDWFQDVIYKLKSEEDFNLKSFLKTIKTGRDKFRQRLEAYEHEMGKKIAILEGEGTDIIVKSLIYEGVKL